MRKLIIRFAVAVVTFLTGITTSAIFCKRSAPPVAPRPAEQIVDVFYESKPQPPAAPPRETNVQKGSDVSIAVLMHDVTPSLTRRFVKLSKDRTTIVELDLGEDIDSQEVSLHFGDNSEYRILERYRTSMSISAEGPHLDLVDWRHFDSHWVPLRALGAKRFRTLASDQMDWSAFPPTTKAEIMKEVRRQVGNTWPYLLELVKDCRGPNDWACLVSISSIYLRVQRSVRGQWIDKGVIEVRIPMGC